jgi:hypothetical protein
LPASRDQAGRLPLRLFGDVARHASHCENLVDCGPSVLTRRFRRVVLIVPVSSFPFASAFGVQCWSTRRCQLQSPALRYCTQDRRSAVVLTRIDVELR